MAQWGFDPTRNPIWFLSKLMIEPDLQGRGLGRVLLGVIKQQIAARCGSKSQSCLIVLDCWAGNDKLRAFYEENEFKLHGVFGEHDYEIAVFVWRC
jgi:GNAT superfamily N-acetyltransferase